MTVYSEREGCVRPDDRLHPLDTDWRVSRPMYMRNAQYALAARRWLPDALSAMREGNPSGLTAGLRWMYTTSAPKDSRLTPKQIDAMCRECYRRAVTYFIGAAKEAAEIFVSDTERLLEDAEICASKVDVTPDWDKRKIMRRAHEVAIPRTIE